MSNVLPRGWLFMECLCVITFIRPYVCLQPAAELEDQAEEIPIQEAEGGGQTAGHRHEVRHKEMK